MALTAGELRELTRLALTGFQGSQDTYTGLGWTAQRAFLRYDSGIIATAENSTRPIYTKDNNGWAVVAYMVNVPSSG